MFMYVYAYSYTLTNNIGIINVGIFDLFIKYEFKGITQTLIKLKHILYAIAHGYDKRMGETNWRMRARDFSHTKNLLIGTGKMKVPWFLMYIIFFRKLSIHCFAVLIKMITSINSEEFILFYRYAWKTSYLLGILLST